MSNFVSPGLCTGAIVCTFNTLFHYVIPCPSVLKGEKRVMNLMFLASTVYYINFKYRQHNSQRTSIPDVFRKLAFRRGASGSINLCAGHHLNLTFVPVCSKPARERPWTLFDNKFLHRWESLTCIRWDHWGLLSVVGEVHTYVYFASVCVQQVGTFRSRQGYHWPMSISVQESVGQEKVFAKYFERHRLIVLQFPA